MIQTAWLKWLKRLPLHGKFGRDVIWNISSLVVLSISGIILNVLIGRFYSAEILGVFNQVYALYILLSQLAVGGVHLSVLKYISQFADDRETCNRVISSALALTALTAGVVCFFAWLLRSWLGGVLQSPSVGFWLVYVLPGLWCFAVNKVLMSALNGWRLMRVYAVTQALRYILMVAIAVVCVLTKSPGIFLALIFSGAELILLIWLGIYTLRLYSLVNPSQWGKWLREHVFFGSKALPSGVLSEVNTRIDVLLLGFFTTDRIVGIYSFAAILAEGMMQFIVVVRTNVNPVLTRLFATNQIDKLKEIIHRGIRIFYPVMVGFGTLAVIIYPLLICLFLPDSEFMVSWPVFCILTGGIMLSAGYLPFKMLLLQTGFPGCYSVTVILEIIATITLGTMFIPKLGMYGAGLATSLSCLLGAILLKIFTWRKLRMRI